MKTNSMKMLIRFIIPFFLIFFLSYNACAQWQSIGGPSKGEVWSYVKQNGRLFAITRNSVSYTDNDGKTWKLLKGSNQFVGINDFKLDGNDIYLSVSNIKPSNYHYFELYKTSDIGENWIKIPSPESFGFDVFNDTLVLFDNGFNNKKMIVKTDDETKTLLELPISDITHGPVIRHQGYYFYVFNNNVVRTKDFVNREIVFQQDLKGYINPIVLYQNQLFFIRYSYPKSRLQIFKYNGSGFDMYSEHAGILNPFVNYISGDDAYFCIKQESTGSVFISNDTLKTFQQKGTSDFKAYFLYMEIIDGHFYGSRDNAVYRINIDEPTTHENITNNFKGFLANTFTFSNDVLYSDQNPVWAFDTKKELWSEIPGYKHNSYAVLGDSVVIFLKKTYGKQDSLMKNYRSGIVSLITLPATVVDATLRHAGDFIIYGNSTVRYISKDAGASWYEYRSSNWDNYLEVSGNYVVRSTNLASYISKDLINWVKIKSYFKDKDLAFISANEDIYKFDGYYLKKESKESTQISNINLVSNLGGASYMAMHENLIFLAHPFKGVFYSPNEGLNWFEFSEGLDLLNFTDLKLHGQDLYLGAACTVFKRPITDVSTHLKSGIVFFDVNENGKKDSLEVGVPQMKVFSAKDQSIVSTDSLGAFNVYASEDAGNEISVILPIRTKATNGPLPITSSDTSYNLGLYFEPDERDVSIKWLHGRTFRPGFVGSIKLIVKNHNFFDENTKITLHIDKRLTLDSASFVPTSVEDTLLTWDNFAMDKLECKEIELFFRLDSTTSINEILEFTGSITLLDEADVDITNNECKGTSRVRGSFDPNDKMVNPADDLLISNGRNDDVITYTIRFQNTGNYPAEFVRIVDTLDSKIDLKSFEFLSASHAVSWSISGSGVLSIRFNDINLVDSFTNNLASQGYFAYTVRLKDNQTANTTLRNTANIYFDYNQAIITNTVQNTLALPSSTHYLNPNYKIHLYPQPARYDITLRSDEADVIGYSIMHTNGALVQTASLLNPGKQHNIKVDYLRNGSYIIRVKLEKGEVAIPFIKIE